MDEIQRNGSETIATDFSLAFTPGIHLRDASGEALTIRVVQAGELLVTSGSIVACDPYWLNAAPQAYTAQVPRGRFPVFISIAEFAARKDRRIACAKLRFNTLDVVRWEMALVPGQDMRTLSPGQHFCYGVDAGTGCFVDLDVVNWLFEQAGVHNIEKWRGLPETMADTPDERGSLVDTVYTYFETVVDARLSATEPPTPDTVPDALKYLQYGQVTLNDVTGGNLVLFSSGWGDGCYPSYFGYATDGTLACLVTDFSILFGAHP